MVFAWCYNAVEQASAPRTMLSLSSSSSSSYHHHHPHHVEPFSPGRLEEEFNLELQLEKMARRLEQLHDDIHINDNDETVTSQQASNQVAAVAWDNDTPKYSYVVADDFSMEVQRQVLAEKVQMQSLQLAEKFRLVSKTIHIMTQEIATTTETGSTSRSALDETETTTDGVVEADKGTTFWEETETTTDVIVEDEDDGDDVVTSTSTETEATTTVEIDETAAASQAAPEVIVEAEFVSPLASNKPHVPNLYQVGFELDAEADKTKAEKAAAEALEQKVKDLQQRVRFERLQNKTDTTSSSTVKEAISSAFMSSKNRASSSSSTLDTVDPDLKDASEKLVAATQQSKLRLSALDRAKAALLEMQAEVDDLEERVRQAKAKNKNNQEGDRD